MHARVQVALLDPAPQVDALRAMFQELVGLNEVNHYLAAKISAADIRYDMGAAAPHPLVGSFAPEAVITRGAKELRLAELLQPGHTVLLDLDGHTARAAEPAARSGYLDVVTGLVNEDSALAGLAALLIRPDGYIAWAAAGAVNKGSGRGLNAALRRWLG